VSVKSAGAVARGSGGGPAAGAAVAGTAAGTTVGGGARAAGPPRAGGPVPVPAILLFHPGDVFSGPGIDPDEFTLLHE
jgi:hypothetical protein